MGLKTTAANDCAVRYRVAFSLRYCCSLQNLKITLENLWPHPVSYQLLEFLPVLDSIVRHVQDLMMKKFWSLRKIITTKNRPSWLGKLQYLSTVLSEVARLVWLRQCWNLACKIEWHSLSETGNCLQKSQMSNSNHFLDVVVWNPQLFQCARECLLQEKTHT